MSRSPYNDIKLDKIYNTEMRCECEYCMFGNSEYFIDSLEKSLDTNRVWQSEDRGIYYYCDIFKYTDSLSSLLAKNLNNKLYKNNIKLYYFNIVKINENINSIVSCCPFRYYN